MDGLRAAARAAGQRPARPGPGGGVQHDVRRAARSATTATYAATDLRAPAAVPASRSRTAASGSPARGTWFLSAAHDDADIDADARAPPADALAVAG